MSIGGPSQNEEEFFAKQEIEKRKYLAKQIQSHLKDEEQQRLKDLHHMHCPRCGFEMQTVVFQGYIIDKCFNCGSVTLGQQDFEKMAGEEGGVMDTLLRLFK